MDFITGLPRVQGRDCIYVVVDRLTKFAHFFTIPSTYTTTQVVDLFYKEIFRLHGLPRFIVSDRDSRFLSAFWQELFRLCGTELTPSTNYHPQTDGQTEIVNKWVEGYLRNYVTAQQRAWVRWVEHSFEVGDMVYLRLQPYRQSSLKKSGAEKLRPRFYGPYRVIRRVGEVAYKIKLLEGSCVHNVFHLSRLKKAIGQGVVPSADLPPLDEEGRLVLIPTTILDVRERTLRNRMVKEYLVKWRDLPNEDSTWENEQIRIS
ncbi:uncharacterized protein LOC131858987 [Cryptomeria japonica]|uniref:uncharacterized protein LOC131858987 n=1 Tax=Cryptomeria japonica TaxID=3369 RepID=UPI0027DA21E4|nr:uncharacterized protein LOC131858987 [Cryptomeria japonica]